MNKQISKTQDHTVSLCLWSMGRPVCRQGSCPGHMKAESPQWGSLAEVESLNLESHCFSLAHSLQLCLDSPNCLELLYLMALGDGFCHVTLAPNFSFSLGRL